MYIKMANKRTKERTNGLRFQLKQTTQKVYIKTSTFCGKRQLFELFNFSILVRNSLCYFTSLAQFRLMFSILRTMETDFLQAVIHADITWYRESTQQHKK